MTGGVAVKLGGVQALDVGHAALVLALMLDTHTVFEDVDTFGQVVDVEV